MNKTLYTFLLVAAFCNTYAQKISFVSNGRVNTFKKVDTLFFAEYNGQKPSTKTSKIDTGFSSKLLQFENTYGVTAKSQMELKVADARLSGSKKVFTTSYYAYDGDGTLEAPTSTLFFRPKNASTVFADLGHFGTVRKHLALNG